MLGFFTLADSKPLLLSQNMGSQIKLATLIVLYFIVERCIFSKVIESLGKNGK